jgi:PAS domain S-box-containing protein
MGSFRDITERKQAEEALRKSEERFRLFMNNSPTFAWMKDEEGRYVYISQSFQKRLGARPEDRLGKTDFEVHPRAIAEQFSKNDHAALAAGHSMEFTEESLSPDGERCYWLTYKFPFQDASGEVYVAGIGLDITEHKRAEQALRENEQKFRQLAENIDEVFWVADAAAERILYVSPAYERVWRRSCQSLYQDRRSWLEAVHADDRDLMLAAYENQVHNQVPVNQEYRIVRPDESVRWIWNRGFPVRDDTGRVYRIVGIAEDITERKRAEENRSLLAAIVASSDDAIIAKDLETVILSWNAGAERLYGYAAEEAVGKSVRFLFPPERVNQLDDIMEKIKRGQTIEHYETERVRKDGTRISVSVTVSPITDSNGAVVGASTITRDITERKRAEEALRRSEAYLAAGQRLSHTGSWALKSSGEVFWSQETYRIFGFDPAKTTTSVRETLLQRIHPEDRPRIEEVLKTPAVQKEPCAVDYRIALPDGSIKHIHDVIYPVTNEAGDVVERYGVVMDITERRQAEEALQRSRDQLRALAARLESVREEERTRVAREIHDELGQALTAIKIDLSSLVHDLPADKKQESESIKELVDEAIQSVRRISTELRPGILDAVGLVAAVEWAAGEFEARTGSKCQLDLPQEDIAIDQERATALFRIFQETLTNVARHANATEVKVRLAKEDGHLTLEVHDNGKGASEKQLSAGSSLGILGMRERALLLGGELTITGAPGEGTIVRVRIPEALSPPPKDAK